MTRVMDSVGYVVRKFPVLSETFILNEILALEAMGVKVQIFSLAASVTIGVMQTSSLATEIPSALFALAILLLLWATDATRYFRGLAPDEPVS